MKERLTEKIIDKKTWKVLGYENKRGTTMLRAIQKLVEYETAEKDGRVAIVPPLNIGDAVYLPIDFQHKIYTGKVEGFKYAQRRGKWVVEIITDDGDMCYEAFDDFGKTFFSDAEEAGKALKEMEGRHE